ncbi:MAG TPA: glycoside hydrolase family 43 protein [Burkholderiales bacterium]|nr:glycoside hydrolase family 43 protein [Burkholderiales bacterium]
MRLVALLATAAVLAGCAGLRDEPPEYRNPLLHSEFADPAVLRAPDGTFYAYATQGAPAGRMLNIQVARSKDLVRWEHRGDALPDKPAWGAGKQWFWAPHVLYDAQLRTYFMYYSAEPDGHRGKCLAVATAAHPEGPFVDSGRPLQCGGGIEHIDPMAFDDPATGRRLLYWGSGGMPIRVQELAPDRLRFAEGSAPTALVHAGPRAYRRLVEAAWVSYRDGWYYLFYSGDRCCTVPARYAVMVARSRAALGPFEDREAAILEASDAWHAPGHCAVVDDDAGTAWMLYHAMDANRTDRARLLLMDSVHWRDGWPQITGPSTSARAPRAGPTRLP